MIAAVTVCAFCLAREPRIVFCGAIEAKGLLCRTVALGVSILETALTFERGFS